jgi:hypothetical protein
MFAITPEVHQRLAKLLLKRLSCTCYDQLVQASLNEVVDEIIFAAQINSSNIQEVQAHIEHQLLLVYQISAKHELADKRDDLNTLATRLRKSLEAGPLSRLHMHVYELLNNVLCADFPRTMVQMEHYESSMRHVKRLFAWLQDLKRQNINILLTVQWKASSHKLPFFSCVSPTASASGSVASTHSGSPTDSLSSASSCSSTDNESNSRKRKHTDFEREDNSKAKRVIHQIEEDDEEEEEEFQFSEEDELEAFDILQSLKMMIHDPICFDSHYSANTNTTTMTHRVAY